MASRMHGPLVAAARVLGLAMAIVVITTLATGWLYSIRADVARWPGPMVRDVLPLDCRGMTVSRSWCASSPSASPPRASGWSRGRCGLADWPPA